MSKYQSDIPDDIDDYDEYGLDNKDAVPSRWQRATRMKVGADPQRLPPFMKQFIKPTIALRSQQENQQFYADNEIRIDNKGKQVPQAFINWSDTQFPSSIMRVIEEFRFQRPTPIQAVVFPIILAGNDVIGIAQTGSGKTVAYLLPGLIHITNQKQDRDIQGPQMLILAPTRELAMQIHSQVAQFVKYFKLTSACIFGGIQNRNNQSRALGDSPDIIVACPGRLLDFLRERRTTLRDVTYLVIDEADRMLDMGFEKDVRSIVEQIRSDRQTTFFSATWPRAVRELANDFCQENPIYIQIGRSNLTINKDIYQEVICLFQNQKLQQLMDILDSLIIQDKVLIFAETRASCERLAVNLTREGYYAIALHGDKTQVQRDEIMKAFKTSDTRLLCATDLASRGLDVSDITVVINYDFPRQFDDYIHRIGRTGRAHRKGRAYSFLSYDKDDRRMAVELIKLLKAANSCKNIQELEIFASGNHPIRNNIQHGRLCDDQLIVHQGDKTNFIVPKLSEQETKLYYEVQQQRNNNAYQDQRNYQGRPQQNRNFNQDDRRGPQTRQYNPNQQSRGGFQQVPKEDFFYNSEFQMNNRRNEREQYNSGFTRGGNDRNFAQDTDKPSFGRPMDQKPDYNRHNFSDQGNYQRPENGPRYGQQRQNDNGRWNGQRNDKNFQDRRNDDYQRQYNNGQKYNNNQRFNDNPNPRFNNDNPRFNNDNQRQWDNQRFNNDNQKQWDNQRFNNDNQRQQDNPRFNNDNPRQQDNQRFNNNDNPRQQDNQRFNNDNPRQDNQRFNNNDNPRSQDNQRFNNDNTRQTDNQRFNNDNQRQNDNQRFNDSQRFNDNQRQNDGQRGGRPQDNSRFNAHENYYNDQRSNNQRFQNNNSDRNQNYNRFDNDAQQSSQQKQDNNQRFQQVPQQQDYNIRRNQNDRMNYEQTYEPKEQTKDDVNEEKKRKRFDESMMEPTEENPNQVNSDKVSVHSKQSIPKEERQQEKEELNNSYHSNSIRREEGNRFQEQSRWDNQDRRSNEQNERQDNRRDQMIQRNERIQDNQESDNQFDFSNYANQVNKGFGVAYETEQQGRPVINSRKNSNENEEPEQKDSQINY